MKNVFPAMPNTHMLTVNNLPTTLPAITQTLYHSPLDKYPNHTLSLCTSSPTHHDVYSYSTPQSTTPEVTTTTVTTMAGQVVRWLAEVLIIAFVAFALIFEIFLHKLEHWIMHRHPHIQTMLRNLYREIMILGIISFCFIMFIFIDDPVDNTKMTFEVSHVWVFLFACFHTFVVGLCIYISLGLSKRWKNLERMELIKYLEQKQKYRSLTERRNKHKNFLWRHVGWWLTSPSRYFQYSKLHETMAFHDIRWQFIYYRNLAPEFRFSKYLRKIKFATFIELVEINPFCWIVLIAFICLDLLRYHVGSSLNFEASFLIAHAVLNMILVTVLARKIRMVYWKLTKNPATYYDNIDPSEFRTELAIAEEEAKIREELSGADSTNDAASRGKRVRIAVPRLSRDSHRDSHDKGGGEHHHAIHHNMAYVPEHHNVEADRRYSLDVSKAMLGGGGGDLRPVDSTVKPARYVPAGGETSEQLVESTKRTRERRSMDAPELPGMSLAMPVKELDNRARPSHDVQIDDHMMKRVSSSKRNLRMEALRRLREKKARNAAIVENAQDVQAAQSASPAKQYHWIIVKLFPRLGRVASAAEKLFWFGSHRFYLFCVELVLFFMNVNVSTAIAKLAFNYKERAYLNQKDAEKAAKAAGKSVKMLVDVAVHALQATTSKKKIDPRKQSLLLLWIAFAVGVFAMLFVFVRIADIMKKYIFVLNNANLLPESMMTQTIHTISIKDAMEEETMRGYDTGADPTQQFASYDYDSDDDEFQNYSQMRRNISTFFENEGNAANGVTTGMGERAPLSPGLARDV